MATVKELSALLQGSTQNPAPRGAGICPICRGFPREGRTEDRGCAFSLNYLDAVASISYAPEGGQLHHALRGYKEPGYAPAVRIQFHRQLASVLWRFLDQHESCVAIEAGAPHFGLVAVVPSKTTQADDERGALRTLVGETCLHTAPRFDRVLRPTGRGTIAHQFQPDRYEATRSLKGCDVLLIEDTWTTGANVQSAALALKNAGADTVGCVAIGRYITPDYEGHGERLAALPRIFDWDTCAVH